MRSYLADNSHYTRSADNTHLRLYAIVASYVDGYQVIALTYTVGDNLSRNHLYVLQQINLVLLRYGCILLQLRQLMTKYVQVVL